MRKDSVTFTALWYILLANAFRKPSWNFWEEPMSTVLSLKMIHLYPLTICALKANSLAKRTLWLVIGKIHIQKKLEKIYSKWNLRAEGQWLLQHSIIFSHTCCLVTCINNSSWIRCQHYHLQLCCWHAFAISLKIPLIFWLFNSWTTPHLNIQKSILFQPN